MISGTMTRRRMIGISAAAAGMALLPLQGRAAPESTPEAVTWRGEAMGAQAFLVIHHPDRAKAQRLAEATVAEVRRLERIFSLYRDDSDLTRLNRQRFLVAPPKELVELLRQSRAVWALTGGAFDPTVQPLWDAYRRHFSTPDASEAGPPAAALRECLARVGLDRVACSPDRIELSVPGSALTLNGIAQGYVTDKVVDLLKAGGIERSMVDMGESRAIGSAPGDRPWRIGISDPRDAARVLKVLDVEDRRRHVEPVRLPLRRGGEIQPHHRPAQRGHAAAPCLRHRRGRPGGAGGRAVHRIQPDGRGRRRHHGAPDGRGGGPSPGA